MKTLRFFILLIPMIALAEAAEELATVPLPNLTQDTLVGTWEAVIPTEINGITRGLYRLEVAKGSDSYLIAMGFELEKMGVEFVSRGIGSEVRSGDVTLRFKTVPADEDTKAEEIVFKGSGVCRDELGAIHGTLSIGGKPLGGFTGEIWFHKGPWTRDFQKASKEAERHIQELRTKPKT